MLSPLHIVQTTAQPTAVIHVTIAPEDMPTVIGPGIEEVMSVVAAQGIAPAGAWFVRVFTMDDATIDLEIGVPIASHITPAGRVQPGHLPAATVARTIYRGPYEGLGNAWGAFTEQISAAGHAQADGFWDCYVKGPESTDNPDEWETELNKILQ